MAMLDDEFGGLMDDPSTQPGGAQERFIMGLLGSAANKKGYASLGLPLLSLLLRDQMQGFDAERKKQAQMAQVAKALQAKRLQTQMEHEQQKMQGEQEQQRAGGVLADLLTRGVPGQTPAPLMPGQEGPSPAPGFEVPRVAPSAGLLAGQALKAGPQGLDAAKIFLDNQAKTPESRPDPIEVLRRLNEVGGGGGSGVQYAPNVSAKGEVSFRGQLPPEVQRTAAFAIESQNIPSDHPEFKNLVGQYIRAQQMVGAEAQNLAFQELEQRIQRMRGGGQPIQQPGIAQTAQAGGTLLDRVRQLKVQDADAVTRARETAQREESRLPENVNRRVSGYREMERGIETISTLWEKNPGAVGWIGKGIAPFASQWNTALDTMLEMAGKKEYVDGAIIGRVEEFLGTLPPGQAEFYRRTLFLQDQMLRAQSGQQTAEQEAGRLARLVPRVTDEPTVFIEKLAGLAEQSHTTIMDLLEGATKSPKQILEEKKKTGPTRTPGKTNKAESRDERIKRLLGTK